MDEGAMKMTTRDDTTLAAGAPTTTKSTLRVLTLTELDHAAAAGSKPSASGGSELPPPGYRPKMS
jgi:hypothetical protein